ncbi:undecaprenyl-phosphate glucose phosphotransferase [Pedobacter chinensis]|uniref:Undecaprenyl-phosphate glucose phosphotransferase n=1 Tax=Pedobacter chinensis TaxID=2282421 RepID=A0A369PTI2_9SPHI|nr:undecaprenyl-phosphate glucose phosphotransferase [Pedobacter chinensis]RDC54277.1 undecaprenyl-phosphate glucose phosphotransferase [Pedobacter chinensis]
MTSSTRYLYLLRYILPVTDVIMLNLVYFLAYYLTPLLGKEVHGEIDRHHVVVYNLIWLFSTAIFGLYTSYGSRKLERIYRGTYRSLVMHFVLYISYLLFSAEDDFSRTFLIVFYLLLGIAFILNRFTGTYIQYVILNKFKAAKKVAVMGSNPTALRLSQYIQKQRSLDFCGFVGDDEDIYDPDDVQDNDSDDVQDKVLGTLGEAADSGVKEIYVAVAPHRMNDVTRLVAAADHQCIRLKFIPDIGGTLASPYTISYMGGEFPIITLRNEPLEIIGNRFKKRAFDLVFSSLVIIFVLSWLYPIIAILIKIQSPGPVLFKQLRSGRNDEPFWCWKFRSMRVNNESDKKQATKDDDRITKIGHFLRRTSLDEMPQFFNVFYGSMSVVGPRPHMLKHTEEYKKIINQFMVRHFLKPGITGWAQVNGFRGETKENGAMENRVKFDIYYLENWTSMLDIRIIFMTVINVFRGEDNAY